MAQIIYCSAQKLCPFLFTCAENICQHNPIWPLTFYTTFIYLLIPLFLALANIGGVSGGYLKVPLFMDLLNYTETTATFYTYPLILGGGIANFFLLVPQRHPYLDKPLVDYNLVNVLLPCVIVGSTIGVICNLLIPELALDILVMLIFGFIAVLFSIKYKQYLLNKKINSGQLSKLLTDKPKYFKRTSSQKKIKNKQFQLTQIQQVQQTESEVFNSQNLELQNLKKIDSGINYIQILRSFLIYIFFQVLSLMVQGKIFKFQICESLFAVLFSCFIIVFFIYLVVYFFYQKPKYQLFSKINYKYEVDLSRKSNYMILCTGGVIAGLSTGLIAAGCGHIMILFMLSLNVNQKVASATSGYQVMFIGASVTIQAVIQGSLKVEPLFFFLILSLVGSFILSIIAYKFFEKMPDKGQGKIIIILIILSIISIVGVIPNIIMTQKYYGWSYLLNIRGFNC